MIPRMRGMRAAYWQDGDLYDLEEATKLPLRTALLGLECWTDREGRFEWVPRVLKLNILPYDKVDFADVLDALAKGNFVTRYDVGGKSYGLINPEFWKEQNINAKEAASGLPEPPADVVRRFEQGALAGAFHSYRDLGASASVQGSTTVGTGEPMPTYVDTGEGNRSEVKGSEAVQQHADVIEDSSTVPEAMHEPVSGMVTVIGLNGERAAPRQGQPLPAIVGKRTFEAVRTRLASIAAEIAEGTRARLRKEQLHVIQAELVFGYWCAKTGHEKSIFDSKRERTIIKQLEMNGGDTSELLYAVDGALRDEHLQGKSKDSTRKYDGIETIFRDRAQVERLAGLMKKYKAGAVHEMAAKYASLLTEGGGT